MISIDKCSINRSNPEFVKFTVFKEHYPDLMVDDEVILYNGWLRHPVYGKITEIEEQISVSPGSGNNPYDDTVSMIFYVTISEICPILGYSPD